jgi:hypothetical protein
MKRAARTMRLIRRRIARDSGSMGATEERAPSRGSRVLASLAAEPVRT